MTTVAAPLTLSAREYAALVGMSPNAIYEAIRRGDIPNVGHGRKVRIPRAFADRRFAAAGAPLDIDRVTVVGGGQFT